MTPTHKHKDLPFCLIFACMQSAPASCPILLLSVCSSAPSRAPGPATPAMTSSRVCTHFLVLSLDTKSETVCPCCSRFLLACLKKTAGWAMGMKAEQRQCAARCDLSDGCTMHVLSHRSSKRAAKKTSFHFYFCSKSSEVV